MTAAERIALMQPKLDRAATHLDELKGELKRFVDTRPYQVTTKRNPDRRLVYQVSRADNVPSRISAIAGDAIQNIRSVLDHLAYQLVDLGTNSTGPFRHVYFPIGGDLAKYQSNRAQQTRGMRSEAIAAIDGLQPYKGGK